MKKKDETLRATLLGHARSIAEQEGPGGINIRTIAKRAGVASGTVYNYFSNKEDILLALTEEFWLATLEEMQSKIPHGTFIEQLAGIYSFLREHIQSSGGMLMASLRNIEPVGRQRMQMMHLLLGNAIMQRLQQDTRIRQDVWTDTFTQEKYAHFIIMNMVLLLQANATDIHFFLEIVKRTLY